MAKQKKILQIVLIILSLVLFLTACGKKDAENAESSDKVTNEDDSNKRMNHLMSKQSLNKVVR